MSFAFDVLIPLTVGMLLVPVPVAGMASFESKGEFVFAPLIPKALTLGVRRDGN